MIGLDLIIIVFITCIIGVPVTTAILEDHCNEQHEEAMRCRSRTADRHKCYTQQTWFCRNGEE